MSCVRRDLSDGPFHLEIDEPLEFDRVFHWELLYEIVNKSVHSEAHGGTFRNASLLHVKNLFCTDLADRGLVLAGVFFSANGDRWVGIRPAFGVNQ